MLLRPQLSQARFHGCVSLRVSFNICMHLVLFVSFFCSPKLFYDGILPLLVDRGPLRGFKPAGQAREQLTADAIPTHSRNIADALVAPRAESTAPALSATQLPLGALSCQPMHTSNGSASANLPDTPAQLLQALANTQDGEFQTPQRAGTCYYRCILAAFNVMLKRRGLDSIAPRHTLYIRIHEPSCTLSCFAVDKCCTQCYSESKHDLQSRWPTCAGCIATSSIAQLHLSSIHPMLS